MEFNPVQLPQVMPQLIVLPDSARGLDTAVANLIKHWQPGQIHKATVITPTNANGQTRLQIAGVLLLAQTDKALAAGETLDLKLAQLPTLPVAKALNVPLQQLNVAQSNLLLTAPEPLLKAWQAGQLLRGTVLEQGLSGETLLDIEGRLLRAMTTRALGPGVTLALRVLNLSNPLLQIVEQGSAAKQTGNHPPPTPTLQLQLPAALLQSLQPGAVLQAYVKQAMHDGSAVLNINGRAIAALTPLPLTPGQTLTLEIINLGKPPVLLPVTADGPEDVMARQLRALLAQQTGLPELLSNLAALSDKTFPAADRLAASVGEQLRALAQQILQQLPRPRDVASAKGVEQALQQSGLFLEHHLAQSVMQQQPAPVADLKASLLRLLAILQRQLAAMKQAPAKTDAGNRAATEPNRSPAPPLRNTMPEAQGKAAPSLLQGHMQQNAQRMLGELLRQVSGGLARIQLHQLASVAKEQDPARSISTEVPVHHAGGSDVFHIRIDEAPTQAASQAQEKTWSVTLAFDIGALGPMHVKLTLGARLIHTTFWTERPATKALIDSQLAILHKNMLKAGIAVGQLICHHGPPPRPVTDTTQPRFIVDVQA